MHLRAAPAAAPQVLHRTVTINVFEGEDVVECLEEVVLQRQFTAQVGACLGGLGQAAAGPGLGRCARRLAGAAAAVHRARCCFSTRRRFCTSHPPHHPPTATAAARAQEVDLLARLARYEVAGMYGEMDLGVEVGGEDAYRLIVALRKL